jgi:hypothetical protein
MIFWNNFNPVVDPIKYFAQNYKRNLRRMGIPNKKLLTVSKLQIAFNNYATRRE